ncbi:MAG: ABC transporter permease [Peptococcaceae bacterium]|nr:ABC transporter permease [Peptococcaceae bacterium]
MNLLESVRLALEGIAANKLRSFLTTLGIVIGIAAVIAVVAVGQAGRALLMSEMEKVGTNIFAVMADWRKGDSVTGREFSLEDASIIKIRVPEVSHLSPVSSTMENVRGTGKNRSAQVYGTSSDFAHIRKLDMKRGRYFSPEDELGRRRVAVVDQELAEDLFGRADPLGQSVVVKNTPFVVVGIVAKGDSIFGIGENPRIFIPIQAWQYLFSPYISYIEGSAAGKDQVEAALSQTIKVLERRHQAPGRYQGVSMEQQMQAANRITGIMTLIISAIAGISLLVGGIGVMNIMLVSVTERTREIGIRMALGARRRDILVQFLIEAVVLCLLGGVIGMSLGIGGAFLIAWLAKWPPLVSWWTVLVAFAFSAAIGVIFGILPANKAARLDPIEALRRE